MRNFILYILIIIPEILFGQDIREIFVNIPLEAFPSSGIERFLIEKREYLMYKGNLVKKEELRDNEVFIDTIDVKNGYIKCTAIRGLSNSTIEMCYWKTNDGQKLIGLNYSYCATTTCGSNLFFYNLIDNKFIKHSYPSPVIDKLSIDMFLDIENSSLKIKNNKSITNTFDEILADMFNILYYLPQNGKDIIAKIDCGMDENLFVFKRKEIVLRWDGNRFNIKK